MTFVVGITGRICTGKSTISKTFEERGIPVIDCDKLGHELYQKDSIVFNDFIKLFGKQIIGEDGNINRKELSKCVFNNPENVKKISDLTWPAIYELLKQRINEYGSKGHKIVGVEAALLIKVDWPIVNSIWQTRTSDEIIIERLQKRNNLSREDALKRLQNQPSQQEYDEKSEISIDTSYSSEETAKSVNEELNKLLLKLQIQL